MAWAKTSYSESIHDFIAALHRQLIEATAAWDGRCRVGVGVGLDLGSGSGSGLSLGFGFGFI